MNIVLHDSTVEKLIEERKRESEKPLFSELVLKQIDEEIEISLLMLPFCAEGQC